MLSKFAGKQQKELFRQSIIFFADVHTNTYTNKEVQNISGMKYSLTRKQIDYFYRMPADYSSHPITLFL